MESDLELVEKAKRGEAPAFRQLLERHYGMMYRVAYRFTGFAEDAEDITQEVCMALAGKLGHFKGKSAFSTWLYRVVVNACRDFGRSQGSRRRMEKSYAEVEKAARQDGTESGKMAAWLYRRVAELEPDLKETALLVLAEDLSHAEAAEALGCAESTISWRMHEIRKKLKNKVSEFND